MLRKNSLPQIEQLLRSFNHGRRVAESSDAPLEEAENAVERVLMGADSVELSPQSSYVRRLQHLLAQQYNLRSISGGTGPSRRVTILRSTREA